LDASSAGGETNATAQQPLMEKSTKSYIGRLYDKYSFQQQTSRIVVAECFLQAATRQASDP
jgi:hypothetical protein